LEYVIILKSLKILTFCINLYVQKHELCEGGSKITTYRILTCVKDVVFNENFNPHELQKDKIGNTSTYTKVYINDSVSSNKISILENGPQYKKLCVITFMSLRYITFFPNK